MYPTIPGTRAGVKKIFSVAIVSGSRGIRIPAMLSFTFSGSFTSVKMQTMNSLYLGADLLKDKTKPLDIDLNLVLFI